MRSDLRGQRLGEGLKQAPGSWKVGIQRRVSVMGDERADRCLGQKSSGLAVTSKEFISSIR